jgi:hypothetical protein
VVLGDGAPWIWALAAEHFAERTEVVDWCHACAARHLWALGKALWGEDAPAPPTATRDARCAESSRMRLASLPWRGQGPLGCLGQPAEKRHELTNAPFRSVVAERAAGTV